MKANVAGRISPALLTRRWSSKAIRRSVAVDLAFSLKHPDMKRCSYCRRHKLGQGTGARFIGAFIDKTKNVIGLGAKAGDAVSVVDLFKEMLE